jgi:hypothetical protein
MKPSFETTSARQYGCPALYIGLGWGRNQWHAKAASKDLGNVVNGLRGVRNNHGSFWRPPTAGDGAVLGSLALDLF